MNTQTTRRPADGVYYTTLARLREVVPRGQFGELRRSLRRYGEEDPIPVTQALIHELRQTRCSDLFRIPIEVMLRNKQITMKEQEDFWCRFWRTHPRSEQEAAAFMDLLLSRAKREGRA